MLFANRPCNLPNLFQFTSRWQRIVAVCEESCVEYRDNSSIGISDLRLSRWQERFGGIAIPPRCVRLNKET